MFAGYLLHILQPEISLCTTKLLLNCQILFGWKCVENERERENKGKFYRPGGKGPARPEL